MPAQIQLRRELRQRLAAHQSRPQPRQRALIRVRVGVEKQPRHAAIENRIAEEFQSLVVTRTGAAVRQGGMTERWLRKYVAECPLYPIQCFIRSMLRNHCTFTVLSKCTDNDTLAM